MTRFRLAFHVSHRVGRGAYSADAPSGMSHRRLSIGIPGLGVQLRPSLRWLLEPNL